YRCSKIWLTGLASLLSAPKTRCFRGKCQHLRRGGRQVVCQPAAAARPAVWRTKQTGAVPPHPPLGVGHWGGAFQPTPFVHLDHRKFRLIVLALGWASY